MRVRAFELSINVWSPNIDRAGDRASCPERAEGGAGDGPVRMIDPNQNGEKREDSDGEQLARAVSAEEC